MSEMFDTINAKADAAAAGPTPEQLTADDLILEAWKREEALRKKAANRRADWALALRLVCFGLICAGLLAALNAGLIAGQLALWLLLAGFTYMGAFAGAWVQFRFGKDGVWKWH